MVATVAVKDEETVRYIHRRSFACSSKHSSNGKRETITKLKTWPAETAKEPNRVIQKGLAMLAQACQQVMPT